MSYQKPAYAVIRDRLLHWYLFAPRTFAISLEQLAQMYEDLEKPVRIGWGPGSKREKITVLQHHLQQLIKAKKTGQLPTEV